MLFVISLTHTYTHSEVGGHFFFFHFANKYTNV